MGYIPRSAQSVFFIVVQQFRPSRITLGSALMALRQVTYSLTFLLTPLPVVHAWVAIILNVVLLALASWFNPFIYQWDTVLHVVFCGRIIVAYSVGLALQWYGPCTCTGVGVLLILLTVLSVVLPVLRALIALLSCLSGRFCR
eukprot:NODE_2003_length_702_cov_153.810107_g1691_i0.p2 GENE.NODE_2003_length_702_cov_153.810107_g1691_i0~~NODE_2003_length_702_cov_153.810107_g1691_i0.p2  ORF type:complete len:151 (-),score=37.92 NODE_2003_length_702_cov_153.810107_g1691_i0:248-676(-)